MRKFEGIVALAMGLALAASAPALSAAADLAEGLVSTDGHARAAAQEDLAHLSPEDSKRVVSDLIKALKSDETDQREHAAEALGRMGPAAADAATALGAALNDEFPYVRSHSAEALSKIGPAAIPVFTAALKNPNEDIRATAAGSLGQYGTRANQAIPNLVNALHDFASPVRARAAHALEQIGPEAVEPLLHVAETSRDASRPLALQALGGIQSTNETLIPRLINILEDSDSQIRMTTIKALARQGNSHIPDLIGGIKSGNAAVRSQVAEVLADVGRSAAAAVPGLIDLLNDSEANVRASAARALGQMGSIGAKTAVAPLKKLLQDGDPTVVLRAREALTNLTAAIEPSEKLLEESRLLTSKDEVHDTASAVKPPPKRKSKPVPKMPPKNTNKPLSAAQWIKRLQNPDEAARAEALNALIRMGAQAVPALTDALQEGTTTVRQTVASAFIQVDSTAAVEAFQTCAKGGDLGVRLDAILALQTLGPRAASATRVLIDLLRDPSLDIQTAAAAALEQIGTGEAKKALKTYRAEQLKKTISGFVKDLQQEGKASANAGDALVKIGSAAVKPVAELLTIHQATGRRAAAAVLMRLGTRSAPATPALIAALDDTDKDVRTRCAETLAQINSPAAQKALRFFPIMEQIRRILAYFKLRT